MYNNRLTAPRHNADTEGSVQSSTCDNNQSTPIEGGQAKNPLPIPGIVQDHLLALPLLYRITDTGN